MGAVEVEDAPLWQNTPADLGRHQTGARYQIRRLGTLNPRLSKAVDRLFVRLAPCYGPLFERSSSWLRWRYLEFPDQPAFELYGAFRWGRLVGWSVFRRDRDILRWCDALIHPDHPQCAASMLQHVTSKQAPALIQAWFSERPAWWIEVLRQLGFTRADEPNGIGMVCVSHKACLLYTSPSPRDS